MLHLLHVGADVDSVRPSHHCQTSLLSLTTSPAKHQSLLLTITPAKHQAFCLPPILPNTTFFAHHYFCQTSLVLLTTSPAKYDSLSLTMTPAKHHTFCSPLLLPNITGSAYHQSCQTSPPFAYHKSCQTSSFLFTTNLAKHHPLCFPPLLPNITSSAYHHSYRTSHPCPLSSAHHLTEHFAVPDLCTCRSTESILSAQATTLSKGLQPFPSWSQIGCAPINFGILRAVWGPIQVSNSGSVCFCCQQRT